MRSRRRFAVVAALALFAVPAPAYPTTVTPSDRVQDSITVRTAPRGSAAEVEQLEVGHEATLLTSAFALYDTIIPEKVATALSGV